MKNEYEIDRSQIIMPQLTITDRATQELKLMIENDFTLEGKYFRIVISGKGCDGFDYQCGFDTVNEDDFQVPVILEGLSSFIIMSPFVAYYFSNGHIDFIQDLVSGDEGFVIKNLKESQFKGKFWKKNSDLTPPLAVK